MSEQPQVNEPESRLPDGTLKDQSQPPEPNTNTNQEPPNPETKPPSTEVKPPESEKKPEAPTGAPEKYEAFTLPEGVELKGDTLDKASSLFKELGLPQEAAQKVVDLHIAEIQSAAKAPIAAYDAMRHGWKVSSEADPDIGPFTGSKALAMKESIGRALDSLNNPKLKADFQYAMDLTGLGDNPAFIKVGAAWAKSVIEPRNVRAGGPSEHGQNDKGQQQRPSAAEAMYPNLKKS